MERTARSRFADGVTIIPLLPPSSRSERPSRCATVAATARPIDAEPVADTSGSFGDAASRWPTSRAPTTRQEIAEGTSEAPATVCWMSAWQAIAHSDVFSDGFQTTVSPQTHAIAAFQAHTATGKLNAVMTPTGPSGCHCSVRRWPGRSLAIVLPYSWRLRP